jgi:hypothetical protein
MSSFDGRSKIYLFDLVDGKKRLAYGVDPEDALQILAMRLSEEEMAQIVKDKFRVVKQVDLRPLVPLLG